MMLSKPKPDEETNTVEEAPASTDDREAEIARRLALLTGPDEPEAVSAPPETEPEEEPVMVSDCAPAPVSVEMPKSVPAPVQPTKPAAAAKPNNKSALLVSLVYVLIAFCGMFGVCNSGSGKSLNIAYSTYSTCSTIHKQIRTAHLPIYILFSLSLKCKTQTEGKNHGGPGKSQERSAKTSTHKKLRRF
jgi:hypothetical protein